METSAAPADPQPSWSSVLRDVGAVLLFRADRERLAALGPRHLTVGVVATWMAGVGRWWDDPTATTFQHTGLGSILYALGLSTLLWLVARPLCPTDWRWRRVFTYVTLSAPPAVLYAIPVERVVEDLTAAWMNVAFLGVVAVWRVALWARFLRVWGELGRVATTVATLLPITGIVFVVAFAEHASSLFVVMGGLRGNHAEETAQRIVGTIVDVSGWLLLPLIVGLLVLSARGEGRRGLNGDDGDDAPPAP